MSNRSLTDRTEASDAFNAGSIPVGCIMASLCFLYRKITIRFKRLGLHERTEETEGKNIPSVPERE